MPPCRTTDETRPFSSGISRATMPIASAADLRCWLSKSGGTYSASMTGVIGSTLIRRTVLLFTFAIITAVSSAGLASLGSAKSIGSRMRWYMASSLSPPQTRELCHKIAPDGARASVRGADEGSRRYETLKPPGAGMKHAPVAQREIDDRKARRRESLLEPLPRFQVTGGD